MMQTLLLEPGDLLQTKSTDLPPGQFIKLQPQDTNFLDISDPKAVLETAFRNGRRKRSVYKRRISRSTLRHQ
jgi:ubiquitin fusion degradation protein 1